MSFDADVTELLELADRQFEEGSVDEIEAVLVSLGAALDRNSDVEVAVELRYSISGGLVVLGDHAGALEQYQELRKLDPTDPELDYWEAVSLFHRWRFDEARQRFRRYQPIPDTEAGLLYYEGLLFEFAGDDADADRCFAAAAAIEPESYQVPFRLPAARVEALLEELVQRMPDDVRHALDNVQVSVASLPDPAVHDRPDVDPLVLGLYTGVSMMDRDSFGGSELPERVEVFQRNVERVSRDESELRHELEITLKHEIGHHLGWDEDDLADRGLA